MTIVQLVSEQFIGGTYFSGKKLKKLYPDWMFISYFMRNTLDLNLKMLLLIWGTLLYDLIGGEKILAEKSARPARNCCKTPCAPSPFPYKMHLHRMHGQKSSHSTQQ